MLAVDPIARELLARGYRTRMVYQRITDYEVRAIFEYLRQFPEPWEGEPFGRVLSRRHKDDGRTRGGITSAGGKGGGGFRWGARRLPGPTWHARTSPAGARSSRISLRTLPGHRRP